MKCMSMRKSVLIFVLFVASQAWAGPRRGIPPVVTKAAPAKKPQKTLAGSFKSTAADARRSKPAGPRTSGSAAARGEVARPSDGDPDRERMVRLQEALDSIVHGRILGRLRVGLRVEDLANGRVLYGWRSGAFMDPASNQKVLATTAALLRLGNSFRYRTEVTGKAPDNNGRITGDLIIRGNGDPSLRARHIESLAESLVAKGVTSVAGSVLADARRIGSDDYAWTGRPALRVGLSAIEIHVRPAERVGAKPTAWVRPASDSFVVVNHAETRARGKGRISVDIQRVGGRFHVIVGGKTSIARGEVAIHRTPADQPLFAAILLREALLSAGIAVHGGVGHSTGDGKPRLSKASLANGEMVAVAGSTSDTPAVLVDGDASAAMELLALHESDPLPLLLRRVNKNSDNEWAERVLETVGAEVLGGAPTVAKGVRVLRDALSDLGLPGTSYIPENGSGLGHQNRVTAAGMAELLRRLYFDPRVGPELMQSLSVGGVDGTTRNRFRGSPAAHRVRAKTGTLSGVSCLSGYVGDGSDVLAFSILVEGHRRRAVRSIRGAQVSAVNAMLAFTRRTSGALPGEDGNPGNDFETGDEVDDSEETGTEAAAKPEQERPE